MMKNKILIVFVLISLITVSLVYFGKAKEETQKDYKTPEQWALKVEL